MTKSIIISALAVTSAIYAAPVNPNGPWQVVRDPVTTNAAGIITSNTNNGPDGSSALTADNTNVAYWNNPSADVWAGSGADKCYNIGCFVTGTSAWDPIARSSTSVTCRAWDR